MKHFRYFLMILLLSPALSRASQCVSFKMIKGTHELCWQDEHKAWISPSCLTKPCEALIALSKKHSLPKTASKDGGSNPNTRLCHQLKLKILIMRDRHQNEQSFCQFADKSIVDVNALTRVVAP
jgi:hypothetical protein